MPLDMKYLEFCQDGSPFYVPSKSATVNPYKEAYSTAGKTHPQKQVENQKEHAI